MEKTESKTHNYIIKYCNTLRYCIDIIACAKYRDTEQNRFFPPPLTHTHSHTHKHTHTQTHIHRHTYTPHRTHTHTHTERHPPTHTHTHTHTHRGNRWAELICYCWTTVVGSRVKGQACDLSV